MFKKFDFYFYSNKIRYQDTNDLHKMIDLSFLDELKRMNKRQLYYQILNFGMIVSTALMIWKGLMIYTGSESPIVVVLR